MAVVIRGPWELLQTPPLLQAFIDQDRPDVPYVNSITCINTHYNTTCFNDGYHIGQ